MLTQTRMAFFVRCDRSTMDQNDLDNGRLVCLIGVAVVKPARILFEVEGIPEDLAKKAFALAEDCTLCHGAG